MMKLKTIVIIIGAFLVLAILAVFGLTLVRTLENRSSAQLEVIPSGIEVVNLTENSATIIWSTNPSSSGKVKLLNNTTGEIYFDDRDLAANADKTKRKQHFVTIKNLKPSTNYKYLLLLNDAEYGKDKNLNFTTLSAQASLPTPKPIYGQADTDSGEKAGLLARMIAKTSSGDALPLVSLTNQTGGYSFDLANLRNTAGDRISLVKGDRLVIDFDSEDNKQAQITVNVQ